MLRLDWQFYAFFMVVLSGAFLAFQFDLLRVLRWFLRPGRLVSAGTDLLFWVVATLALTSGLFMANWAELRFYVVVGILIGIGLYFWLASRVVVYLLRLVVQAVISLVSVVLTILYRMLWLPLVAVAGFVAALGRTLWNGLLGGARVCLHVLQRISWLVGRPLVGPFRCVRLHYLRLLRRWRRRFRR